MHAEAEAHDSPYRWLAVAPLGLGVDWTVQDVPSQRSASGSSVVLVVEYPVAVQAEAEAHDTPSRKLAVAPLTVGVDRTVQDVPSQRSASAW